ncbi:hypothetical protein BY458DRAFT_511918 [Sporodiniella umbellata]|nr:hypothetical protein BY458DRAFT_511918 [Sporodiniella umbellata]
MSNIRPSDLNTWIHRSLKQAKSTARLYLYSHEYVQLASTSPNSNQAGASLSLISPYNLTDRTYLQVDVQVLNSKIIDSPHIQYGPLEGRRVDSSSKWPKKASRRFQKSRIIS